MDARFTEKIHVEKDMSLRDVAHLFQEGANHQFSKYLMGEKAMWSRGIAWVIVRRELFINDMPKAGDEISLTTWAGKGRHGLYPRWFEIRREKDPDQGNNGGIGEECGEVIINANCQWAIIDLRAREMLFSDYILGENAPYCEKHEEGARVKISYRFPELYNIRTVTSTSDMIDGNNHVNNSYYLRWLEDLYIDIAEEEMEKDTDNYIDKDNCNEGEPTGKSCAVKYLWIEYSKEILPESTVELRWESCDEQTAHSNNARENYGDSNQDKHPNTVRTLYVKGYTGDVCHFSAVMR